MFLFKLPRLIVCICIGLSVGSRIYAGVEWEPREISPIASIGVTSVDFAFGFKNTGKFPVEFDLPSTSCGCTLAKWDKTIYAAGESGFLKGVYNTSGKRGLNVVTITIKGAEIDGDMRRPVLESLKLNITIPEVVKISPGITLWRKDSDVITKTVRFEVNEVLHMPLKLIKISRDTFTGEWREVEAGRAYEFVATPTSTKEAGKAVVTVEGINKDGKPLRFYAHLIIR